MSSRGLVKVKDSSAKVELYSKGFCVLVVSTWTKNKKKIVKMNFFRVFDDFYLTLTSYYKGMNINDNFGVVEAFCDDDCFVIERQGSACHQRRHFDSFRNIP